MTASGYFVISTTKDDKGMITGSVSDGYLKGTPQALYQRLLKSAEIVKSNFPNEVS